MSTLKVHNEVTARFIDLANRLHESESIDKNLVSAGLMAAAGLYNAFRFLEVEDDAAKTVNSLKMNLYGAHRQLGTITDRFMETAKTISGEEGSNYQTAAAALVAASGIYATFAAAGNDGYLQPGGVAKISEKFGELLAVVTANQLPPGHIHPMIETYRGNLEAIQAMKRRELEARGVKTESA